MVWVSVKTPAVLRKYLRANALHPRSFCSLQSCRKWLLRKKLRCRSWGFDRSDGVDRCLGWGAKAANGQAAERGFGRETELVNDGSIFQFQRRKEKEDTLASLLGYYDAKHRVFIAKTRKYENSKGTMENFEIGQIRGSFRRLFFVFSSFRVFVITQ